MTPTPRFAEAGPLAIAYEQWGRPDGPALLLLHGFPYDPRAFDQVAATMAEAGWRVIVPYLRGFGPTRFREATAFRSGEQAALADDVRGLMDALGIDRAVLAGFDWGGRAACVAALLWPRRVQGLVAIGGYLVQDPAATFRPLPMAVEERAWHQYFLASARGRQVLEADRQAVCRHFWRQWSPDWAFTDETFARSAVSFDNPDFVAVVTHSYAHRIGAAAGDPAYAALQARLAGRPAVAVPAVLVRGETAPLGGGGADRFERLVAEQVVPGAGHNPAQERPESIVAAIRTCARAIDAGAAIH